MSAHGTIAHEGEVIVYRRFDGVTVAHVNGPDEMVALATLAPYAKVRGDFGVTVEGFADHPVCCHCGKPASHLASRPMVQVGGFGAWAHEGCEADRRDVVADDVVYERAEPGDRLIDGYPENLGPEA